MKKILALALAAVMLLGLAACGGSAEPLGCEGKYASVAITALGMVMTGEDAAGMELNLEVGGKGSYSAEGKTGKLKWSLEGSKLTASLDGQESVATWSKDKLEFSDFMGMGLEVVFAIEGSAAADPFNYMAAEEKQLVGVWYSYEVADVLGDPLPGVDPFGLMLELKKDHTATVRLDGETLSGGGKWSVFAGFGSFEEDQRYQGQDATVTFEMLEDGKHAEVTFNCGEMYYIYICGTEAEAQTAKANWTPDIQDPPDVDVGNNTGAETDPVVETTPVPDPGAAYTGGDEEESFFPLTLYLLRWEKDGEVYGVNGNYLELTDEENGLVCFRSEAEDDTSDMSWGIQWIWYEDDTFAFTDADGDIFEGVTSEDEKGLRLTGTYMGYQLEYLCPYFPIRYEATLCMQDDVSYECDGEYVELTDAENGVVCFNGELYDLTWSWYEDDSFDFTDESGDVFEGQCWGNTLLGTYCGYDYVFEMVG